LWGKRFRLPFLWTDWTRLLYNSPYLLLETPK
jgi:hypothetical protein